MDHVLGIHTPFLSVAVACDRAAVAERVAQLVASYRRVAADSKPSLRYTVQAGATSLRLERQAEQRSEVYAGDSLDDLLAALEGQLYRDVVAAAARQQWVALHAAALVFGEHALLFVGESGAGKSTLTLELLRSEPQARYLTDDIAFVSPSPHPPFEVAGLPRLIGFEANPDSAARDEATLPAGFSTSQWRATPRHQGEPPLMRVCAAVPPERVCHGSARLAVVVFPRYEPSVAEATCEPLGPRDAATELWQALDQSGADADGATLAFDRAAAIAASTYAYRLRSASAAAAHEALAPVLRALQGGE